ncbi:MAG: hypothetical protein KatS3mg057_3088 [Herpetosiphonaceae bacterium]|nr:MAG: hypothetical protein KatS3mg057_3088 [Herpetosiphonaceae bacterium]
MTKRRANRLITIVGSFLLSNGLLLLVVPQRFARLRKLNWMPEQYNGALDRITSSESTSRSVGLAAIVAGLGLMALAVSRTEPEH